MVGLFGGSFDPVHQGHLVAALVAREVLGLAEVRLVVAGEQPFKSGQHQVPGWQRAEMVARAIAGVPGLALERCEVDRPGPSYTIDTLRLLRQREPGVEFVLLAGADAARELPTWREGPAIPALARVVALTRPGGPQPAGDHLWRLVEVPRLEISATEVRRRVAEGRSIRGWVPDAVEGYIRAHGLYLPG